MSIPGTGASVATTFDGPALTKKGKGRKALEMALFASVFGDTSSDVITILAIAPIALIALQIGPPELGAVLFLSLIVIAARSEEHTSDLQYLNRTSYAVFSLKKT